MKPFLYFTALLILLGCSNRPYIVNTDNQNIDQSQRVFSIAVVNYGWHTGIIIPAESLQAKHIQLKTRFPDAKYFEIGWGDKGFYQANEITSGLTIQAIFWPTQSVVHVVSVEEDLERYISSNPHEYLCLTTQEFQDLIHFVSNSFSLTDDTSLMQERKGIYGNSQFYLGVGDYYMFNTCNKWVAKSLSSSGMDIWTTFKLSASSIMNYLESSKNANSEMQPFFNSCEEPNSANRNLD